jgi:hypothetical protein
MRWGWPLPRRIAPEARADGDAPASPSARSDWWSIVHAAPDTARRGRANQVPRTLVSDMPCGRTSPVGAWKGLPIPAPAGGTAEDRRMIPVLKTALPGLATWQARRSSASSGKHVRQWTRDIQGSFQNQDHSSLISQVRSVFIAARLCQLRGILKIVREPALDIGRAGGTTYTPLCSRNIT